MIRYGDQQRSRRSELRLKFLGNQFADGPPQKLKGFLLHQNNRFAEPTAIGAERYNGFETPFGSIASRTRIIGNDGRQWRCAAFASVIIADEKRQTIFAKMFIGTRWTLTPYALRWTQHRTS